VSVKEVALGTTTPTRLQSPAPLLRQMAKAVSLLLLSAQVSFTWVGAIVPAVNPLGAAGATEVVT